MSCKRYTACAQRHRRVSYVKLDIFNQVQNVDRLLAIFQRILNRPVQLFCCYYFLAMIILIALLFVQIPQATKIWIAWIIGAPVFLGIPVAELVYRFRNHRPLPINRRTLYFLIGMSLLTPSVVYLTDPHHDLLRAVAMTAAANFFGILFGSFFGRQIREGKM